FNRDDRRPSNRDERPSFNRDDRRPFNRDERPSFNRDDRRPFNRDERPAFNRDDRRPFNRDERPAFNRDDRRPSNRDDRKPFSHSDKPIFNREDKRAFDRADKPFEGEKFEGDGGRSLALRSRKPEKVRAKGAAPIKLEDPTEPIRLNRFIAMSGVCSRRQADDMITLGEVTVNGVVITELGTKVLRADKVELRGEQLRGEKMVYVIMNKPKGFVTSVDDPHNDKSVVDLLKGQIKERVYPVGRLDKNTTGVLLLTNDGQMTMELTHPSFEKRKIYHVFLDKPCTEADLEKLVKGVELEDGEIHADEVSFVDGNSKEVGVEIHSGRNRIIRRMFESLGYDVVRLDRVYFAGFTKMGLRRGFWRHLTEREVATLKGGVYR
ncbi:MAG: pseudouridine synthase, partial [Mucinivorans sp.]